jgi:hypothetical protein
MTNPALAATPQGSTDPVLEGQYLDNVNAGATGTHNDGADYAADTQLLEDEARNVAADSADTLAVDERTEGAG